MFPVRRRRGRGRGSARNSPNLSPSPVGQALQKDITPSAHCKVQLKDHFYRGHSDSELIPGPRRHAPLHSLNLDAKFDERPQLGKGITQISKHSHKVRSGNELRARKTSQKTSGVSKEEKLDEYDIFIFHLSFSLAVTI